MVWPKTTSKWNNRKGGFCLLFYIVCDGEGIYLVLALHSDEEILIGMGLEAAECSALGAVVHFGKIVAVDSDIVDVHYVCGGVFVCDEVCVFGEGHSARAIITYYEQVIASCGVELERATENYGAVEAIFKVDASCDLALCDKAVFSSRKPEIAVDLTVFDDEAIPGYGKIAVYRFVVLT